MRIFALEKFRKRNRQGCFQGLPRDVQYVAYRWLDKFITRWRHDLPAWRLAILVGQAKRLALNPPTSAWGRSMLAKRGGLAAQRNYRIDGRCPTTAATAARLTKQRRRKKEELFRSQYRPYLEAIEANEEKTGKLTIKQLDLF
jgi:hypothetical protein